MTEEFISSVLLGTEAGAGSRVFLRRIFPIQDETRQDILVSEAIVGDSISHIDNCHVLVIQEPGDGLDYDNFIISKIREINVQFESRDECCGSLVELSLDPKISYTELVRRLGASLGVKADILELFKCYATKSMMKRPGEFPVEVGSEKNVESLLEWCLGKLTKKKKCDICHTYLFFLFSHLNWSNIREFHKIHKSTNG